MNNRVFSPHLMSGICLLLLSSFCFGEDPEIIADVKQIIYSSPFRSYMHKYPKLLAYSEKRDIPMNRIESVIIDHIRDIIDGREKVILSSRRVGIRMTRRLPLVVRQAHHERVI